MSSAKRTLCKNLLYAESEREVIDLLKNAGYWDDDSVWRNFGDIENNWAQIGIQQAHPVAAMVEKLVNSIDAVLMRECRARGIPLESINAPQNIDLALEQFFGIKNGNLANIGATKRSELAQDIGFIATGRKNRPNYTVFDRGEGQTPRDMPETLLSLSKSNKLRIPFVQGKFNMGGTGVLPFCGTRNFQLVISRRCPTIVDSGDLTSSRWGFTIVRRQDPADGARSTIFTYLAPNQEILSFDSDALCLPCGAAESNKALQVEWGTILKMFEYKMTGYLTNVKLDLYYAVSALLPRPGLPVRFYEFRDYKQDSPEATLAGLLVRLQDDRGQNIEDGFPTYHSIRVRGEFMNVSVYAFKADTNDGRFRGRDGVLFTLNGQTHGSFRKGFFSRQKVKMGYIADSILLLVDATGISARAREDLFMNSRDRMRRGELFAAIEDKLADIVRNHPLLRALREERRRQAIANKISDSKPLKEVLDKIFKKSPVLAALFITGTDLRAPFRSVKAREKEDDFKGEYFPSYFRLMKKYRNRNERPISRGTFRFQYETDVVNDYLQRDNNSGTFRLLCNGEEVHDSEVNLHNGIATLNIGRPANVSVGDVLRYQSKVYDVEQSDPFEDEFEVLVTPAVGESKGEQGKRQPPVKEGDGSRTLPGGVTMPNMIEVREAEWDKHGFDRESALKVMAGDDESYDYFINMDNLYLLNELRALSSDDDPKLMQSRFKYAMVLLGMMILKEMGDSNGSDSEESINAEEAVLKFTSVVAPVILPMIDALGDLQIEE